MAGPPTTEGRAFSGFARTTRCSFVIFGIGCSLFALTKKGRAFVWNDACEEVTTTPVLSLPKEEGTYVLDCDACGVSIGVVLSHRIDGEERVIADGSRLLSTDRLSVFYEAVPSEFVGSTVCIEN